MLQTAESIYALPRPVFEVAEAILEKNDRDDFKWIIPLAANDIINAYGLSSLIVKFYQPSSETLQDILQEILKSNPSYT